MNQPIKVCFDQDFLNFGQNCLGKIEYPGLCNTSGQTSAEIVSWGMELPKNPSSELIKYATTLAHGNLRKNSVIQVLGGAAGFDRSSVYSPEKISSLLASYPESPWIRSAIEIFQAASSKKATVITGGTQSGIMALISSLYVTSRQLYHQIDQALNKFATFLPRPGQILESITPPQLIHVVPAELTVFPGNRWNIAWDKDPKLLAPCTGFIVVPGVENWGNDGERLEETQWWVSYVPTLERIISIFSQDKDEIDRTTVVFNGGLLTLAEVYSALLNNAKIIFINGSGRLADLLSFLRQNNWDLSKINPQKIEEPRLKSALSRKEYLSLLERFVSLAKKRENIYVSDLGNVDLNTLIEMAPKK